MKTLALTSLLLCSLPACDLSDLNFGSTLECEIDVNAGVIVQQAEGLSESELTTLGFEGTFASLNDKSQISSSDISDHDIIMLRESGLTVMDCDFTPIEKALAKQGNQQGAGSSFATQQTFTLSCNGLDGTDWVGAKPAVTAIASSDKAGFAVEFFVNATVRDGSNVYLDVVQTFAYECEQSGNL